MSYNLKVNDDEGYSSANVIGVSAGLNINGNYNNNNYNNNNIGVILAPINVGYNTNMGYNNNYNNNNYNIPNNHHLAPSIELGYSKNMNNNNNFNTSNHHLAPHIETNVKHNIVVNEKVNFNNNHINVNVNPKIEEETEIVVNKNGIDRDELTDHVEDFLLCGVPYPILTECQALAVLLMNIFFPGFGTQLIGCISKEQCCFWYWIGKLTFYSLY